MLKQAEFEIRKPCMFVALINFDGGCGPTNPGNKYGSYEVRMNGKIIGSKIRLTFGYGTNNEAEFDALILALDALSQFCSENSIEPESVKVSVESDSTIVVNWLNRFEKKKRGVMPKPDTDRSKVMFRYASQCVDRLNKFQSFNAIWKSRLENVARFGH